MHAPSLFCRARVRVKKNISFSTTTEYANRLDGQNRRTDCACVAHTRYGRDVWTQEIARRELAGRHRFFLFLILLSFVTLSRTMPFDDIDCRMSKRLGGDNHCMSISIFRIGSLVTNIPQSYNSKKNASSLSQKTRHDRRSKIGTDVQNPKVQYFHVSVPVGSLQFSPQARVSFLRI